MHLIVIWSIFWFTISSVLRTRTASIEVHLSVTQLFVEKMYLHLDNSNESLNVWKKPKYKPCINKCLGFLYICFDICTWHTKYKEVKIFSIKNIFYDKMDFRLFYFHVTTYMCVCCVCIYIILIIYTNCILITLEIFW